MATAAETPATAFPAKTARGKADFNAGDTGNHGGQHLVRMAMHIGALGCSLSGTRSPRSSLGLASAFIAVTYET